MTLPLPRVTARPRPLLVLANNLATQVNKNLVHVCAAPCRSLVVWSIAPALGEAEGSGSGDGAVFFEVGFVAHDDEGHFLVVFDADDLLAEFGELV